jgi:spermidine/putrescine-binding protein
MARRRYESGGLTRRELLRRAGLVSVTLGIGPGLLAACGGGDEEEAAAPAAAPPAEPGGETTAGTAAAGEVPGGTINFLTWQGYDLQGDQGLVDWQNQNGIQFNATFINTHEDIQAKVTQSPGTYNVVSYYEGYWDLYKQLNVLSPLDRSLVSWVMVYNPDEMSAPSSWQDLLSPSLKNRIAILDDPNCAMLVGARVLGYEPPDMTQDQVDSIIDFYRD